MNTEFFAAVERIVKKGGERRFQTDPTLNQVAKPKSELGDVTIQPGADPEQWILSWPAHDEAIDYEVQTNPDPSLHRNWTEQARVRQPTATITIDQGELRIWVRVRANSQTGPGPWSDPKVLKQSQASEASAPPIRRAA